ncbi:MAG TPA: tetratricopeptide repeat protein [Pyrinomonadaceae bacterium]|jgi:tetratricopeptide (TPR) repeat protein|nr:tetratricopeptide repeat protein [Pyrinomonadaceae bacterium]
MRHTYLHGTFAIALLISALAFTACQQVEPNRANATTPSSSAANGKIAITTSSEEARKEFLAGRDLAEKLRITDSIAHFDKAIALDSNFALAELNRANVSPTAKEFFDHLKKAVALADKASDGERMLIQANEAAANANPTKQKEILDKLVAAYPNDERAHFNLGGYYFGQQDFAQAITHYKRATELAPDYSTAFNILGYAYRQNENYSDAENAFKKYIELIPNDPNPYDSYAELLLKMGRFDEAITQYNKALSVDQNFVNSHFGIAAALTYKGKAADAQAELQKMSQKARTDAERRTALLGQAVVAVDSGKFDQGLAELQKQYAVAEKNSDSAAMTGDLQLKGNILLEMGKPDEAQKAYEQALKTTTDSNLSKEVKDNTALFHHYNLARVAIAKKDLAVAKTETDTFRKGAEAAKNANQVKLAHELSGRIAFEEKSYNTAISELGQANQQNPAVLYLLGQAYQGKGDTTSAKASFTKAAKFNSLPQLNYAFVRSKAEKALAS